MTIAVPRQMVGTDWRRAYSWRLLALLSVLLCASWVQWTTARETHTPSGGGPDAASYVAYAYNLREYGVYSRMQTWNAPARPTPDAVSPPGYPIFLTAFMRGAPDIAFLHRVVLAQAGLGVLTALFAYLLALRIAGVGVAFVAGLLSAITPHLATIGTYLLTESLFTCLLMASMWAFVCAIQGDRRSVWAIAGILFGACCLVRPTLQALLPVTWIFVVCSPHWRGRWKSLAIASACWCLLLVPWFAYKYTLPPSSQPDLFRATLYHGSFPDFMYQGDPQTFDVAYRYDPHAAEIMASYAGLRKWVGARMRAEPARYLNWYLLGKPAAFLSWDNGPLGTGGAFIYRVDASPYISRFSFGLTNAVMRFLHWPLMLLGIVGAAAVLIRPRVIAAVADPASTQLLAWIAVAAIVFHCIGAPYPRYGIPFWPVFYIMGMTLLAAMAFEARQFKTTAPTGRFA